MKIGFVIHGKLRRIEKLKRSILRVFGHDFNVRFYITTNELRSRVLVQSLIEEGLDFLIIAGGDGSINEAVNGYMDVPKSKREKMVLGVLPVGTGNDFARSLGVSKDIHLLHSLIEAKSVMELDVCRMYYGGLNNQSESRYFINIADIGIGGDAIEKVRASSKILGSNLTYVKAIILSFLTYKKRSISVRSPDFNWNGKILSLCMANGKYFGSGMCIAPDAQLSNGWIELVILGDVSLWDYVRNIFRIRRGIKINHKEATYTSVRQLTIETNGIPFSIDMDGEFVGHTPLEVEILPRKIKFLVNIG